MGLKKLLPWSLIHQVTNGMVHERSMGQDFIPCCAYSNRQISFFPKNEANKSYEHKIQTKLRT